MFTDHPFDIVIYHGNCYDGFTAAWVARQHSPNADFVPAKYGDAPPDVAGKRVLIVDFSYPRDVLLDLRERATRVVVFDHHKTAQADLADLDDVVFDMNRSGAGLTWDMLFPVKPRPWLVSYVEDRDIWRFALTGTKLVHAALLTVPFDFDNWDAINRHPLDEIMRDGGHILRYVQLTTEKLAARARLAMLGRHRVWSVNAPPEFISETADVLKDREPNLPILAWSYDGESDDFYCSLRSRDDGPDVSAIAREYGGGGHEHAAGFRSRTCPARSDCSPAAMPRPLEADGG